MTSHRFLTVHALVPLPFHNLNRDDLGLPKHFEQGGVTRAMLSSQSIKRAARTAFESLANPRYRATRTRLLGKEATAVAKARADEAGVEFDEERAHAIAYLSALSLASGDKGVRAAQARFEKELAGDADPAAGAPGADTEGDGQGGQESGDANIIVAAEELAAIADAAYRAGADPAAAIEPADKDALLGEGGTATGSLAIAAFGRMLAASPDFNVDAAISVGPAVTTHEARIETDYFTAVDDIARRDGGDAVAHIGTAYYTSGVYYRTFTIDREQLRRNWTHLDDDTAAADLAHLIRGLIIALPSGKSTTTGAASLPTIVVAEEQAHRTTCDFQDPVRQQDGGGYLAPSITALLGKLDAIRDFDPGYAGERRIYLDPGHAHLAAGVDTVPVRDVVEFVADWVRA